MNGYSVDKDAFASNANFGTIELVAGLSITTQREGGNSMSTERKLAEQFIDNYTGDPSAIRFDWNGKHAELFEDTNEVFRSAVIDCVIEKSELVPVSLLVELYRALTSYSVEAWCIDERVETIGRLMLIKGRSTVAYDYIVGARATFDSLSATNFSGCPKNVSEECLKFAHSSLKISASCNEKDNWIAAIERFEILLKNGN